MIGFDVPGKASGEHGSNSRQLEAEADAAGRAFDRDAPFEQGEIRPGPLAPGTRRAAERTLGAPLGDVSVQADADADRSATAAGALAFTLGPRVVVGRAVGGRSASRRLLAHELAHVVQQRRYGVGVQRNGKVPPAPGTFPTITQVLTEDGSAFRPEHAALQQRYDRYKVGRTNPAPPARWVKLARDSNRAALLAVLGPNLGDPLEPANPDEEDVLRLAELQRPAGYTVEQERKDLELLSKYPGALDAKLTNIPAAQLQRGEIGGGYVRIATGRVGEALAEPIIQQRLAEIRVKHPDAQVFRNVRVRIPVGTNADGTRKLSAALEFSDGIIGRITGSGLAASGLMLVIDWLGEVKGGGRGGQEATGQIFEWIEGRLEDGSQLVLENGLEFEVNPPLGGGVRGLFSAPRGIITGRGVGQLGAGGSMGVAAPIERIELARSPAEVRYLSGLLLQSIWIREQLRRLQQDQKTAYDASSVADFTDPGTAQKILSEHNGLAVAWGRLYQLKASGTSLTISERPVVSLAFVYPPGTTVPGQTLALPGPPAPLQLGPGQPRVAPPPQGTPPSALPPGRLPPPTTPATPPLALPAGGGAAELTPPPMPRLGSASEIAGGAVPATALAEWLPRTGSVGSEWVIWNGRIRDAEGNPVTGHKDGEIWVRVIGPGGKPLPEIDPATGSIAPSFRALTPGGPRTFQATPYDAPARTGPSGGARVVAGGMGVIMLANEIMGPIAAIRGVQSRHNARRTSQIRFLAEFGAEPRWAVEDMDKPRGAPLLPWNTEQEIGAVWGHWRAPAITDVNVPAFLERLPARVPTLQSLVLFLGMGSMLGLIEQQGSTYTLVIPGVTSTDLMPTIERIRADRMLALDEQARADVRTRGAAGVHKVKSQATIHRYGSSQREPWRLGSFHSPVLSATEFLGSNAWVREVDAQAKYPSRSKRMHVEPANAEAAAMAENAWYIVHQGIDDVLEEVRGAGRAVTSVQEVHGTLEGFTAGAFPPELGPTRYLRHPHPDARRMYSIAIGQLLQFWVDRDDLEPVPPGTVEAYGTGTATAPAPSRFFTTEKRQDLPLI